MQKTSSLGKTDKCSQIPRDLVFAALGHAVVLVFVQIILHAGLGGQGYDMRLVGRVAEGYHKGKLFRLSNASSSLRMGLLMAPMMQLPTPLSHAARVMLASAMPVSVARSPGMEVS